MGKNAIVRLNNHYSLHEILLGGSDHGNSCV